MSQIDNEDKPKNKEKVIDMMNYINEKANQRIKESYSKEDIEVMFSHIGVEDTFTEEQFDDLVEVIYNFYLIGLDMGMSTFITRAALHEIVDIGVMIASNCCDNCDNCCHNCDED